MMILSKRIGNLHYFLSLLSVLLINFCHIPFNKTNIQTPDDKTDCKACERINLFIKSKDLVSDLVWHGLNDVGHTQPLLYFTDSFTYVAFGNTYTFKRFKINLLECKNGFTLLKLPRIDILPFHMENNMNFKDSTSLYYNQPMMLCADVETLIKVVPDFNKTEDWLQLVMHEYFHSFQFSHKPTINYLSNTIQSSADTLNKIYNQNLWFRLSLAKENNALLNALNSNSNDSIKFYITEFLQTRQERRMKFETISKLNLSLIENFWETIEGTARYTEYYMAGYFNQMTDMPSSKCDGLFKNFKDYRDTLHFENKQEFKERTKIMQAYYYVTGFNLCRLMDKMSIKYKNDLFNNPNVGIYKIFREAIQQNK